MQERVNKLNGRPAVHRAKWGITPRDVSAYRPDQPDVGPVWLRAMVREADLIVWQMDHEAGL